MAFSLQSDCRSVKDAGQSQSDISKTETAAVFQVFVAATVPALKPLAATGHLLQVRQVASQIGAATVGHGSVIAANEIAQGRQPLSVARCTKAAFLMTIFGQNDFVAISRRRATNWYNRFRLPAEATRSSPAVKGATTWSVGRNTVRAARY